MVFYVLDAECNENKNPQLGEFLSGANPFLFDDIGSADPTIYEKIYEIVDDIITVENSYSIASKYIQSLETKWFLQRFRQSTKTSGLNALKISFHQNTKEAAQYSKKYDDARRRLLRRAFSFFDQFIKDRIESYVYGSLAAVGNQRASSRDFADLLRVTGLFRL